MPIDPAALDIVVVASRRRPPLVLDALAGHPHHVSWTPDYPMPAAVTPHPMAACVYIVNPVGAYRCYRGHQDALRLATKDAVLVFEDDAVPNRPDWMDVVLSAATLLSRFEVVSLHAREARHVESAFPHDGATFHTLRPTRRVRLLRSARMRWCQAALAYLITRRAAARLIDRPYDELPVDHCLPNEFTFCAIAQSPFDHDRRHGSLVEHVR